MPSMSYCQFENTASALDRCVEMMQNAKSLDDLDFSEYELRAFHSMFHTARQFLAEHGRLLNAEVTAE